MHHVQLLLLALAPGLMAASAPDYTGEAGLAQIRRLVGNAECHDDSECRVIGIGAKACGGPEAYLAWSTRVTAADVLAEAVARNAQARRDELDRLGMRSNCAALPVPVARCQRADVSHLQGRCTLESAPGSR